MDSIKGTKVNYITPICSNTSLEELYGANVHTIQKRKPKLKIDKLNDKNWFSSYPYEMDALYDSFKIEKGF